MPTPASHVALRPPLTEDLPELYRFQLDPESSRMAGVLPRSESDFMERWRVSVAAGPRLDTPVIARVILADGVLAGSIACFQPEGTQENAVGYWIARDHWGRGVATHALQAFIREVPRRPLTATAAVANIASRRVLELAGFTETGRRMGEATARYIACEIAEFILR